VSRSHIFLSYSRKDELQAQAVASELTKEGFDIWFDQVSIRPGSMYGEQIAKAIQSARAMLLLFSGPSNESREVHKEVQLASNAGIPIIPIRLADIAYHPALDYHLAAANWVDGTLGLDACMDRLISHLHTATGMQGEPPSRGGGNTTPKSDVTSYGDPRAPYPVWHVVAGVAVVTFLVIGTIWLAFPDMAPDEVASSPVTGVIEQVVVEGTPSAIGSAEVAPAAPIATPAQVSQRLTEAVTGPTVAVMYFDFGGGDQRLGGLRKGLGDMLISDLRRSGLVNVVAREQLETILAELNLQQSSVIDQATAARIGRLLGAEYLVFGSFFELFGTLRMDAKMVRIETGQIVVSEGADGPMTEFAQLQNTLARRMLTDIAGRQAPAIPTETLSAEALLAYSDILDAVDRGDEARAQEMLRDFVRRHPDFTPASRLAAR